MRYKLIQVTNPTITAVAVNANFPIGNITRRLTCNTKCCNTFTTSSSNADTITINESGYYKITYNASLIAEAVGEVSVALILNGTTQVYEVGETAAADNDVVNLNLPFVIRVFDNYNNLPTNCPITIQFKNTGVAVTGGSSNIIIEKIN